MAQHCLTCGAEMILVSVVRDDTMAVTGFEHHTFMCSACNDVERRLVFVKPGERDLAKIVPLAEPVNPAPPISPAVIEASDHRAAPGLLWRVLAKLRRGG